MTLIEKYKAIPRIGTVVFVPWQHSRLLGVKQIDIVGDQLSISNDADYASLPEIRAAVAYLVEQLGGKVKWKT